MSDMVRTIGNDNDEDPYEQAVRQAEIDNKFFEEEARREAIERKKQENELKKGIDYFRNKLESNDCKNAIAMLNTAFPGQKWAVGGFVYRSIVEGMYGTKMPSVDLDILAAENPSEIIISQGWTRYYRMITKLMKRADYGSCTVTVEVEDKDDPKVRLKSRGPLNLPRSPLFTSIDIMFLKTLLGNIMVNTIDNYFAKVPLSVQAIAYDLETGELSGSTGIESILKKEIWINNRSEADLHCKVKNVTLENYVNEKANSLGFSAKSQVLLIDRFALKGGAGNID